MSETITPNQASNPILDPTLYWRVSAVALAAVAILGIVLNSIGMGDLLGSFLSFDWTHNILHVVLAAAAILFGFVLRPSAVTGTMAIVFGFVYTGLGILGFFVQDLGILHLEIGENLVHILLGAWALAAGFASRY